MKYLKKFESFINSQGELINLESNIFDEFPEDVLETLENNFFYMYKTNFDWNNKTKEFSLPEGGYDTIAFNKWVEAHQQTEFINNLNKIISAVREDVILLKRRKLSERKLEAFEELIKPVFGNHITSDALSKFEEEILLNPYVTIEQIEKGFEEAKNLIDQYGNIDPRKTEKSTIFVGGEINIPNFERFVEKYPEYRKTFDIWYQLFEESTKYLLKNTNAHHVVGYEKLRKLYDFLIKYRKKEK